MDDNEKYCLCGEGYNITRFMIECDACKDWFHGECVNLPEYQAADIDKYFCPRCEITHGPRIYKKRVNFHRHDAMDPAGNGKPVQCGTPAFIKQLLLKEFHDGEEIVLKMKGQQLTLPYLYQAGFSQPILVEKKDGLDLHVPANSITVSDVEHYVGSDRILDVIDVCRQADINMTMGQFAEYYNSAKRSRVLNVISLEFSDTQLGALVEAPYIARKLCWTSNLWPRTGPVSAMVPYSVQKYCLMSVKGSYTDFHVDFGGSSVWYHVLRGEKTFYFIRPTPFNLSLYKNWLCSPNHNEVFLGDLADSCYSLKVRTGHTLFVPTGWIHAVYTHVDSLVFGGNFLHSLNVDLQLQVYEIENAACTPEKFKYPGFESLHWYAAARLLTDMADLNKQGHRCPTYVLHGAKALIAALKSWSQNQDAQSGAFKKELVLGNLSMAKLINDLSREMELAEQHLLNHPQNPSVLNRKNKSPAKTVIKRTKEAKSIKLVIKSNKPVVKNEADEEVDDHLVIDERKKLAPFRSRLLVRASEYEDEPIGGMTIVHGEDEDEVDGTVAHSELFQASRFQRPSGNGSQSPSTRDAVVGMLSMSVAKPEPSLEQTSQPVIPKRQRRGRTVLPSLKSDESSDDDISKVHQDDDYIYPSLDASDDEDYASRPSKGKSRGRGREADQDESWNPKARVGGLLPKQERPVRSSAKRVAVERGLQAAKEKRSSSIEQTKRPYKRKLEPASGGRAVDLKSGGLTDPTSEPKSANRTPKLPKKKGLATAKQRLGKILKINKMGY